jgi:hypothetical protein
MKNLQITALPSTGRTSVNKEYQQQNYRICKEKYALQYSSSESEKVNTSIILANFN